MKRFRTLLALVFVLTFALSTTVSVKAATKKSMEMDKTSKTEVVVKYLTENMEDLDVQADKDSYTLSYDDEKMEAFKESMKSEVLKELNKDFKKVSSKDALHYTMTARKQSSSINKAAFTKMVVLSYLSGSDETNIEVEVKVGKKNRTYCLLLVTENDM